MGQRVQRASLSETPDDHPIG